ncbi:ABC transporter ATP-binding protein [Pseudarthrobacter sp. S9]|uniref:ABC transporter ATP-binding protein n=1 Tax=Pseudarthrobacter sp. S9 TaxID=3418421 RepID=UPI003CFDE9C9
MAPVANVSRPVLEVQELYRFFRSDEEETLALRGVTLSVRGGELVAVVGPSGSGKSTLLACAAGLDEPDGGTVRIAGQRMNSRPESERVALRAGHIGVLFQSENLFGHLTVAQNVALVRRLSRKQPGRPLDLLESLGLGARADAYPAELSGGEAARAGLAVALANGPELLLADEPTGELDGGAGLRLLQLLRRHADNGYAVLVVTHSPDVVAAADRVVRLADGRVQEPGQEASP